MLRRPRLTPDVAAAALLLAAAVALVGTPYDGGACRNVAAAYAVPATPMPSDEPPAAPAELDDASDAVRTAEQALAALGDERAAAAQAREAAVQARAAADEAQRDSWTTTYSSGYGSSYEVTSAELDVDLAESRVDSAESYLQMVQEGAAETSPYGSYYDQQDVQRAQDDLDEARAELAAAEKALREARSEESAEEAAAASAERDAEELDAAAEAAERVADEAASSVAARAGDAEESLSQARQRLAALESEHEVDRALWAHEDRVARDEVLALNNVRASCRENGGWRAGVALADIGLLLALAVRTRRPRLPRLRVRALLRR